jgi:hypothetical protein
MNHKKNHVNHFRGFTESKLEPLGIQGQLHALLGLPLLDWGLTAVNGRGLRPGWLKGRERSVPIFLPQSVSMILTEAKIYSVFTM